MNLTEIFNSLNTEEDVNATSVSEFQQGGGHYNNINYHDKYLKYKRKYLEARGGSMVGGGDGDISRLAVKIPINNGLDNYTVYKVYNDTNTPVNVIGLQDNIVTTKTTKIVPANTSYLWIIKDNVIVAELSTELNGKLEVTIKDKKTDSNIDVQFIMNNFSKYLKDPILIEPPPQQQQQPQQPVQHPPN